MVCEGESCPPFKCPDDKPHHCVDTEECIPLNYMCDGIPDCEYGDDEVDCGKYCYYFQVERGF